MNAADDTVIARRRGALRDGDVATTAERPRRIPIGIAVDEPQPRDIDDDGIRQLPVVLDAASGQAFGLGTPLCCSTRRPRRVRAAD